MERLRRMFGYGELSRNQADVRGAVVKKLKEGVEN